MAGLERRWVVHSVEDGVAAVEDVGARMLHLPARVLPAGVREGDVLRVSRRDEGVRGTIRIETDATATAEALRASCERVDRLARDDPGGDIVL